MVEEWYIELSTFETNCHKPSTFYNWFPSGWLVTELFFLNASTGMKEFTNSINNDYKNLTFWHIFLNPQLREKFLRNNWQKKKLNILWKSNTKHRKLWRHSWRVTVNSNNISEAGNTLARCVRHEAKTPYQHDGTVTFHSTKGSLLKFFSFFFFFFWFVDLEILAKRRIHISQQERREKWPHASLNEGKHVKMSVTGCSRSIIFNREVLKEWTIHQRK